MRAAIVLAAGVSRRFGKADKLRQRLAGKTLLDHAIDNASTAGAQRVIVVTTARVPHRDRIHAVRLKRRAAPFSASLAAGLAALRPIEREVVIFLADMPFARAKRLRLRAGDGAVRPVYRGVPGHPLLIRTAQARANLGRDDRGLAGTRALRTVRGNAGNAFDVDTIAALRRARRSIAYR